jgi:hypothetical protein
MAMNPVPDAGQTWRSRIMKQRMEAELIFDHPKGKDRAVRELTLRGFTIEDLDWVDPEGSTCVWIKVRGLSELSEDEFFNEMAHLAEQFGGDVIEAGLQFPPPSPPERFGRNGSGQKVEF